MSEFKVKAMMGGGHLADALGSEPPEGVDAAWWAEHVAALRAEPEKLHPVEMDVGPDGVRRMLRDPDVSPELRARAEAYLAELEA